MNVYSVSGHHNEPFEEGQLRHWAAELNRSLTAGPVTLGLVFIAPIYFPQAAQILETIRLHAKVPLLVGCSGQSLICGNREIEQDPGVVVALYHLPGARVSATYFTQTDLEAYDGPAHWHRHTGIKPADSNGWLAFVDPFRMDSEGWLKSWNEAYAPAPVLGGLASGGSGEMTSHVYLNEQVYEEGGVAVSIGGDVDLMAVTSQGCTPIGDTWTLTRVEQNVIRTIGNMPAYEALARAFSALSPDEQRRARGNLFLGLVVDEYQEDFHRGDFLIRNLLGADPSSGSIAVGALPRAGQTVQFQHRSAAAANEDLRELLTRARRQMGESPCYGACLCSCNGRGTNLFNQPDHDAALVQKMFGPTGLAGFFCNGEIGPVGAKSYLHGYTASLGLFKKK